MECLLNSYSQQTIDFIYNEIKKTPGTIIGELKDKIKKTEESVEAMKIARKSLLKFKTSFEEGLKIS